MSGLIVTAPTDRPESPPRLRLRGLLGLALGIVTVAGATTAMAHVVTLLTELDPAWPPRAAALAVVGGAIVFVLAARTLAAERFGAANLVTLVRAAFATSLLALVGSASGPATAWLTIAVAVLALALDGVDGSLARRRGEASAFGARFDMETDALLIVALAALVWQHGKAGPWILLAGALRYLFVAAGAAWPVLAAPLPASRRRQTVCVVQIGALVVCLAPFVPPPVSAALGLASILVLGASFAADVAWLVREAQGVPR